VVAARAEVSATRAARRLVRLEPHVGGRLFESIESETGSASSRWAACGCGILHAPRVSWRNANFAPDELTEVVVEFAPTSTARW